MSRPQPKVILEQIQDDEQIWQLLEGDEMYVILYKNKPVSIKVHRPSFSLDNKSYKRMSYTEEGTAKAQCRRYNAKFNCEDFHYVKLFN
jgi:hypothetical protein